MNSSELLLAVGVKLAARTATIGTSANKITNDSKDEIIKVARQSHSLIMEAVKDVKNEIANRNPDNLWEILKAINTMNGRMSQQETQLRVISEAVSTRKDTEVEGENHQATEWSEVPKRKPKDRTHSGVRNTNTHD